MMLAFNLIVLFQELLSLLQCRWNTDIVPIGYLYVNDKNLENNGFWEVLGFEYFSSLISSLNQPSKLVV